MRYQTFDPTISATGAPHEYLLSAQTSQHGETQAPIKSSLLFYTRMQWLRPRF